MGQKVKIFSLLGLLAVLCSCAGPGKNTLIHVPGQHVSFNQPDSSWQRTMFRTTEQRSPGDPHSLRMFLAAWRKDNFSTISLAGCVVSLTGRMISKESLLRGIEGHMNRLNKTCSHTDYSITDKDDGAIRENVEYIRIGYEFTCREKGTQNDIHIQAVSYGINGYGYSYNLRFTARNDNFNQDIAAFDDLVESIKFKGK